MNWLIIWFFLATVMTLTWVVAVKQKRGGIVDSVWTFSLGICAVLWYILAGNEGLTSRSLILIIITSIWSYRLGSHLYKRIQREGEDARYGKLIQHWGDSWKPQLFIFYQIQVIASTLLSLAFWLVVTNPVLHIQLFDYIAILVAVTSIIGEAVADKQLETFRSSYSGKNSGVCKIGLWRYSRHPNYFFEWMYWLSFVFLSVGHPLFILSLVAPIAIYFFLTRASGIPYAEKQSIARRGEAYLQYQRETSSFFPWFSKTSNYSKINK